MLGFKKIRKSSRSYGRGMDNTYTPAHYGIYDNGAMIGVIYAPAIRYMESPTWRIAMPDYKEIKRAGSFGDAKAWAIANIDKFGS
jgi:hypothetical protein